MRKRVCKCGKIVAETDPCCNKLRKKETSKKWEEENKDEMRFLRSRRWANLRKRILERDDYHCQRCLIKYGILETTNLEAHHIKSRKNFPQLRWEEDNIICVCKTCNNQLGTRDELDFVPLNQEKEMYDYNLY